MQLGRFFWPVVDSDDFIGGARRRLLSFVCLAIGIAGTVAGTTAFSTNASVGLIPAILAILVPFSFIFIPALVARLGRLRLISGIVIAALFCHLIYITIAKHGAQSESYTYLVAVPILAALLVDHRAGPAAAILTLAAFYVLTPVYVPEWSALALSILSTALAGAASVFQREMEKTTAQLEAARQQAVAGSKAKSDFLANMSHEIRTPLNGVIGMTGVLLRKDLNEKQERIARTIESSAQVLNRLLNDILDYSKVEAGGLTLEVNPFDLRKAVDESLALMQSKAEEKSIYLKLVFAPEAAHEFNGDVVRVKQILINLISNAIKFTEKGGVTVRIRMGDVDADNETPILIEVEDTGIGFDEDAAKRIFHRFQQAEVSTTRRFGGTGLGLSICKALSRAMGGSISATSAPNEGSTFSVTLPLPRAGVPASQELSFDADGPGDCMQDTPDQTIRVLLAEDHKVNQQIVQLLLENGGFDLTVVNNGKEAVDAFKGQPFDLVLMDMQMPIMDGLEATREIRALETAHEKPPAAIAMLTANAMAEHKEKAAEAGVDHYISKPITPHGLVHGIRETLSKTAAV